MFGHVDDYRSWARHLLSLRALQKRKKNLQPTSKQKLMQRRKMLTLQRRTLTKRSAREGQATV